jgi:hypothetical protein
MRAVDLNPHQNTVILPTTHSLEEAWTDEDQRMVHKNPSVQDLKRLSRNARYHSARFVIYKDGSLVAADSEHYTHHSMAPAMGAWEVRGYVTYMGDNDWAYRSMEVYSPQNKDHPLLRKWEASGIENGNPSVVEEKWSKKYKKSIDCNNPKGFSQRAHCAGRRKRRAGGHTSSKSVSEASLDQLVENMLVGLVAGGLTESQAVDSIDQQLDEDLRKWFREKWVRFGPDGKIRGACARGSEGEGKPKCLPQRKAWALGKKKRATAARRKRREDPNPERAGKARNVATKESHNLSETAQDQRDINILAQIGAKWIEQQRAVMGGGENQVDRIARRAGVFNLLSKEAQAWLLGSEYKMTPLLLHVDYIQPSGNQGHYDANNNVVMIKYLPAKQVGLESVLAHELRHAMDQAQSQGEAFSRYTYPVDYASYVKYLKHPTEINARLAETLFELSQQEVTRETLAYVLKSLLYKNGLSPHSDFPLSQKNYQRLLSRAYKFWDESRAIKKIHPARIAWEKIKQFAARMADVILGPEIRESIDDDDNIQDLPSVNHAKAQLPWLLKKVQQVYDNWDEEDRDTYAGGGICHLIADAICDVLSSAGIECATVSCSHAQHVYVAGKFEEGVYTIDIPYHIYEVGGGFSWQKIPGVVFEISDVVWYHNSSNPDDFENYVEVFESQLIEKRDACYYKVKSRYKVWPSAYASGALVQCRKKGAKNWGKSKTNEAAPWEGQGDLPLPTKLYHVTRTRNRLSIRQRGLVPKTKEHDHILRQPGVFGFETFEQAEDWAYYWSQDEGESMDIWEIDVPDPNELTPDPARDIQTEYDAWIIYKPIPASNLRLKFTQRWPAPWGKPTLTVKKLRNLEEDPDETQ